MTMPQQPNDPEIQPPGPDAPEIPSDRPLDVPERENPDWQPPGIDDAPMRMPGENPDVETEL